MSSVSTNQMRYLSQAMQLEEGKNPALIHATIIVTSLAILSFTAWAGMTNINEVARAPGEVVPQGFQQVVQHLEGGIVSRIDVREGEKVEKGAILLRLDGAGVDEDLARILARQSTLGMHEERIRAFLEGRKPKFGNMEKEAVGMLDDQIRAFASMAESRRQERTVIAEQIVQKKRSIATLSSELETARQNSMIAEELYAKRKALNQKGYASDVRLLEAQQNLNDSQGDIRRIESQISTAKAEVQEFQNRLQSLNARHQDESYEKLDTVLAEKAQNLELLQKLRNRVQRLDIRAPVSGLIKGLSVNTVGAVVQPGQTLMEIIPDNARLVVQARIQPQYVGHLKPGQKVQVKVSSFDSARYGAVDGTLEFISATTFEGEGGERYYEARIRLESPNVGGDTNNAILPGMTVMADIITGEKTILQYLLKPVHNALKTAFTER